MKDGRVGVLPPGAKRSRQQLRARQGAGFYLPGLSPVEYEKDAREPGRAERRSGAERLQKRSQRSAGGESFLGECALVEAKTQLRVLFCISVYTP